MKGRFCVGKECEDCKLEMDRNGKQLECLDFCEQHPQLALDLMTNN